MLFAFNGMAWRPLFGTLFIFVSTSVWAQFAAVVSPPRFELSVNPGGRATEIVSITNAAGQQARYRIRTADWLFGLDGNLSFNDELLPNSCRPWVSIESKEVLIGPGRRLGYRVQVDVPEGTPPQECRFALMIEGDEQIVKDPSGLNVPVAGRVAVIYYVAVGGAAPQLEISPSGTRVVNGVRLPSIKVRNTGNAHGRLSGFLSGTDAKGQELDFSPSTFPILPNETRVIDISATTRRGDVATIHYPVIIRGHVEWGKERVPFNHEFN